MISPCSASTSGVAGAIATRELWVWRTLLVRVATRVAEALSWRTRFTACAKTPGNTSLFAGGRLCRRGEDCRRDATPCWVCVPLRSNIAWLKDAPWFLWQADSSDTARMLLAKCEAQANALHKLSHTFAGVGGQWRAQMQVWADGGEPTLALLRALWRYRSAKTDGCAEDTAQ